MCEGRSTPMTFPYIIGDKLINPSPPYKDSLFWRGDDHPQYSGFVTIAHIDSFGSAKHIHQILDSNEYKHCMAINHNLDLLLPCLEKVKHEHVLPNGGQWWFTMVHSKKSHETNPRQKQHTAHQTNQPNLHCQRSLCQAAASDATTKTCGFEAFRGVLTDQTALAFLILPLLFCSCKIHGWFLITAGFSIQVWLFFLF